jgi:hypothetical protein
MPEVSTLRLGRGLQGLHGLDKPAERRCRLVNPLVSGIELVRDQAEIAATQAKHQPVRAEGNRLMVPIGCRVTDFERDQ